MELSSVRLIPFVFDKLFYHIAPADAMVCQSACQVFDKLAYRQIQSRLSTPKKGMLLLAWPFCMHAGEDASNRHKEVEFYDILRVNVMRNAARFRRRSVNVDEEMRKFLMGFESFMLHCVLSNIDLYTKLNVLMLDFHAGNLHDWEYENDMHYAEVNQLFLSKSLIPLKSARTNASKEPALVMDPELWSKVINAVVAQCASTLRHFVFCSPLWLPEQFYTSLKLDCMLAELQQLETLYMPSFEKCEQAYANSSIQGSCWQALIDLPCEKRLPSLRRVVAEHTRDSEEELVFTDAGNNVGTRFVELLSKTTLQQSDDLSPRLAIELVFRPCYYDICYDIESHVRPALPNFKCYARNTYNLALSEHALSNIMCHPAYRIYNKLRDNILNFIREAEKRLLKAIQHFRPQMLSVVDDVKIDRGQTTTIPAFIGVSALHYIAPETAVLALNTLSRRLSWPLSLTLMLNWDCLLKHLCLFTVPSTADKQEIDAAASHWTKSFPRGTLKLCLTIEEGLQQYVASDHPFSKTTAALCLNLCAENSYKFPLQVKIKFCPPEMKMKYGRNDTMPSIREYFTKCMREFVSDFTGDIV